MSEFLPFTPGAKQALDRARTGQDQPAGRVDTLSLLRALATGPDEDLEALLSGLGRSPRDLSSALSRAPALERPEPHGSQAFQEALAIAVRESVNLTYAEVGQPALLFGASAASGSDAGVALASVGLTPGAIHAASWGRRLKSVTRASSGRVDVVLELARARLEVLGYRRRETSFRLYWRMLLPTLNRASLDPTTVRLNGTAVDGRGTEYVVTEHACFDRWGNLHGYVEVRPAPLDVEGFTIRLNPIAAGDGNSRPTVRAVIEIVMPPATQ